MVANEHSVTLADAPQDSEARKRSRAVLLSVCIPAYNRPTELVQLLDSVLSQDFSDYEVVISEDHSPQRAAIRAVVREYQRQHPGRIRYYENDANLGYDANFRALVERATGDFCFIMGNDDVVAPHAFTTVADVITRTPDVGVILRSIAWFRGRPEHYHTIARYYPDELVCPPGPAAVEAFFRRATILSGLVLRRDAALDAATDAFDGLLFYQKHLVADILMRRPGVFVPEVLAFYRMDGYHEFGTSAVERGYVEPGNSTDVMQAVRVFQGMLRIARGVDAKYGANVHARVLADEARSVLPTFLEYADFPRSEYWRLYRGLASLGFWRSPMFHATAAIVAVVGGNRVAGALRAIRRRLGYTPSLSGRPAGAVVVRSPQLGNLAYRTGPAAGLHR